MSPSPIVEPPRRPKPYRFGLRFDRRDVKLLNNMADFAESNGKADVSLFRKAALATERGDVLTVHCVKPDEAVALAHRFSEVGVRLPLIEDRTPSTS